MNSLFDYLVKTKNEFPNKEAVVCGDKRITFSELYRSALNVSEQIVGRNVTKSPIFMYLPKNENSVIAMMAILASGNFYTPTDVAFPIEKPRRIVDGLKPALTITDSKNYEKCLEIGIAEDSIINIDDVDLTKPVDESLICQTTSEDLAYVLFTSGSTGVPKGVTIKRGAVIDYIDWASECFKITSNDSICNQAPFYFDNSTLDIYLMLSTGATLHLVPESFYAFPAKLAEYLVSEKITTIFWVPSVFQVFQRFDLLAKMSGFSLQKILFAGEIMHNKELNYWRKYLPEALYANLYGPTEITVDCTYYIVDRDYDDEESLPIGIQRKNMEVFMLDSDNKLISETNVIGEICVRGYSLSRGYWNDPEKTNKVFVQNPLISEYEDIIYRTGDLGHYNEEKLIMFDGRIDNQIKRNGYRIELGEVENMTLALDYIQQVCVVFDNVKNQLIMFIVTDSDKKEREIIRELKNVLPNYMLPNKVVVLDEIPLNDNGKYNRKELLKSYV